VSTPYRGPGQPTFWTATLYIAISFPTASPVTAGDAKVLDYETGVDARATELLVHGQRTALCLAAVDHEESAEITAMWIEQRHVHALDPAVGLHSPEHSDELVEHLDSPYLAAAHRLAGTR
jgi:hypothetical protein